MNNIQKPSLNSDDKPEIVRALADCTFDSKHWESLFYKGKIEQLSSEFIACLNHYRSFTFYNLELNERTTLNSFVEQFLFFFCNPRFKIPNEHLEMYVVMQPVIANIVAVSDFETTTPWLVRMVTKKENYFKVLALLNARVQFDIDQNILFDISDYFSSEWWSYYWLSVVSYCRKDTWERIRFHLANIHPAFILFGPNARASYFPSTYVAPELDHIVKTRINTLAKKTLSDVTIKNIPLPKKIAFITGRWYRSAVYTSLSPMIQSLKGKYDITLINLGAENSDIKDADMFENIINISMKRNQIDLSAIHENSFTVAIYPDIGMTSESIFLSNIRIAPIQIMMYGHPASTCGSCIDYFIVGRQSEDLSLLSQNYSERPVVLPGLGVNPVIPEHTPQTVYTEPANPDEPLLINCPWTSQKITWPLIDILIEIIRRSTRNIKFCFFSGGGLNTNNAFIPFAKDIWKLIGEDNAKLYPPLSFEKYLDELNYGAFTLDSYPFGGFNTIIDSLHCKKAVVTWKGSHAYNRFAAATLEMLGFSELVVTSEQEYIDLALKMIHDDQYRISVSERISQINLMKDIQSHEDPEYFRKAIDYLCLHHETLRNDPEKTPVYIT